MAARKTQSSLFWRAACPVLPTQRSLSEWIDRIVGLIYWLIVLLTDWLINWLIFFVGFRGTSLGTPSSSTGLQLKGGIRHFLFSHISKLFFRSDISWNFEKFLIHPDGTPVRRYSRSVAVFFVFFFGLAVEFGLIWTAKKRRWCWSNWWWYNYVDDDIKWWWWWCRLFEET